MVASGEGVGGGNGRPRLMFGLTPTRWAARGRLVVAIGALVGGALLSVPAPALAVAPEVGEESVLNVRATSATLRAEVNPNKTLTIYRFEYVTSEAALLAGHGEVFPAPPSPEGEAGAGANGVLVEAHLQDLQPHTTYWYRVLAGNPEGVASSCLTVGTCPSFTTPPTGGELVLPDGRAWELVSPPPGRNGATAAATPITEGGALIQAGEDGDAFAYGMVGSVEAEPAGNTNYSQVLSIRGPGGGWSSRDIATPHEQATGASVGKGQEYRYFSADLAIGLVEPLGPPAGAALLSPGASEKTVYLRADEPLSPGLSEQSAYGEALAEGGYLPLATSCPPEGETCDPRIEQLAKREGVPAGTKLGGTIVFVGATTDLSNVILSSRVPLTAKTPEGTTTEGCGLYEWSGGQLQLISLLPDHEQASSCEATLGNENAADARGAVSSNGSRIVWSNTDVHLKLHLYMRDVSRGQTVQLDENRGGGGGAPSPEFQFASSDGTEVFFTDTENLTADSTATENEPDLYECEMVEAAGGELSCTLRDLTVDSGGHADVQGVVSVGSEEDASLYFVAQGALTEEANERHEKAKAGEDNFYMLHYNEETRGWEAPVFIAALSTEDSPDWERLSLRGDLESVTSRVSQNGEYVAFMSERDLTGYGSIDTNSGAHDEEVFLYDGRTNRLVCVSCNPTGERPAGVYDSHNVNVGTGLLIDNQGIWSSGRWLAGNVPGWTAFRLGDARYQSRYLSDEGRVFFNSPDALVPQATNGLADVYEYEPAGVGGCEASSMTFSERSGGCVGLISSGSSGEESAFMDASASGEDVFFLSSAQLVPADTGSALAVYDAHVCSAASICAAAAVPPPPCVTEASCRAAPSPQPSVFGASGSATFTGAGNPAVTSSVTPNPTPKVGCRRGRRLVHGRCVKARAGRKARARKAGRQRRVGR